jgi:hypothetical protein
MLLRITAAIIFALALAPSVTAQAYCTRRSPCPVITYNPAAPILPDDTPVGTVVTNIIVTMNPPGTFTGTLRWGSPYGNDGGLFAISGHDIVLVAPLPIGSSVQHGTVVATQ